MARARLGRPFWTATVAEFNASEDGPKAFAAKRGVPVERLNWWRTRLKAETPLRSGPTEPARFLDVTRAPAKSLSFAARITVGLVVIELDTLPPAAWVAEFAARC